MLVPLIFRLFVTWTTGLNRHQYERVWIKKAKKKIVLCVVVDEIGRRCSFIIQ